MSKHQHIRLGSKTYKLVPVKYSTRPDQNKLLAPAGEYEFAYKRPRQSTTRVATKRTRRSSRPGLFRSASRSRVIPKGYHF